tara:strand:- start:2916 stop:4196 length:1281 start_codon:yes stop_codon:yes gene_type:complete
MGSLNNLYISQSYQGLLTFSTNSGSTSTLTQISDGSGSALGLYLNNNGDLRTTTSISSSLIEATKLIVRDKLELTGSVDIFGSVTASSAFIKNDLIVSGTLFANKVITLIESSSIIFSSGSNILGDSITDTQILNGAVIISGSGALTGSLGVSGNISSSTLSGMGNVNQFVTSIQSATSSLFTSASLGLTTASVFTNIITFTKGDGTQFSLSVAPISFDSGSYLLTSSFNAYTQSTDNRLSNLETTTASINISLSNLNQYTQSNDTKWSTLQSVTTSLNAFTASQNNLNGTFATTGSNTFNGNQTINGTLLVSSSMVYSGSVRGQVFPITIASSTASMDCSLGNFFTLTLSSASVRLEATNIQPGETLSLRIYNSTATSSVVIGTSIKFPTGFTYVPTSIAGTTDILTFLTFDTGSIYSVAGNYFA